MNIVSQIAKDSPCGYDAWIGELKLRYRATQLKAAVAVNSALIEFYWNLGKDISEKYPGKKRDANFFRKLSLDLQHAIPDATGLSVSNIKYARYFFELYVEVSYRQQVADDKTVASCYRQQVADNICKEHNRVLAKYHLEKLSLPMGITDYQLKKLLPTQAQLAKCYADAEKQVAAAKKKKSEDA